MLVDFSAPGALLHVTRRCIVSVTSHQEEPFTERRHRRPIRHRQLDVSEKSPNTSKKWEIVQLTERAIPCLENIDVYDVK